eukprot:TRINITY_DN10401_c0_g1_i3.p1 TRINITY_DN10401_c0_g1~~TRINITY_DN10401_c0_g1_i3.p1  ORF type:complete len:144 (+),score=20.33 TRINITY_DN10401_c0_g1_i3:281-712(+)
MFTCAVFFILLAGAVRGHDDCSHKYPGDSWSESIATFTEETLSASCGSDTLLLSLNHVVFDVSSGQDFYGFGADYHILVGKEVTRAVALWSLEQDDLIDYVGDLSAADIEGMEEKYHDVYLAKYPVVGVFINATKQNLCHEEL